MPPRVAFWTSTFEPGLEAISSEVALLRRRFPGSVAWGMCPRYRLLLSWRRGYCLHPRLHVLFRAATHVLQRAFHLNHIFGTVGDWFYLRGTRGRPTVLTLAAQAPAVGPDLLKRVDRFVTEFPDGRDELVRLGIEPGRIRLIFPPVDLLRFAPRPAPPGPFTTLFASSPDKEKWLTSRGIPQILDAAALRPQMRFRLLWRPWGNCHERVRQWIAERGLRNVELTVGSWPDMAPHYHQAHATVAPFTDLNHSKPSPNSVIESLACGRPVVVSDGVGLAGLVREKRAGKVGAATGEALAEHLDEIQADWDRYSGRARDLAERYFGVDRFLAGYEQVYDELLNRNGR